MKHQTVCTALGGILHKKQRERTINNNSCSTTTIGFKEADEVTQIYGDPQKATRDGPNDSLECSSSDHISCFGGFAGRGGDQ